MDALYPVAAATSASDCDTCQWSPAYSSCAEHKSAVSHVRRPIHSAARSTTVPRGNERTMHPDAIVCVFLLVQVTIMCMPTATAPCILLGAGPFNLRKRVVIMDALVV